MYQNGLVRVTLKVIPNPEEICPEMCPRILGPTLMRATPCAFVGRRLALTVGGASQTHMFQISLLLAGNCVVNLDMPPLCGWPEDKAASAIVTRERQMFWRSLCLKSLNISEFTCVQAPLLVSTPNLCL